MERDCYIERVLDRPPVLEAKRWHECDECEEPIYDGEEYYQVGDWCFCEKCVKLKVAGE